MSAATQKPVGELPQAAPAFSYAQAAKGMYPSVPSALPSGKTPSETTESTARRTSIPDSKPVPKVSDRPMTKRTASEGRESHGGDLKTSNEPDSVSSNNGETAPINTSLTGDPQSAGHDLAVNSTPSSPGFGTASTSTLPKEDDLFSTPNGSSDSTWEKHSQTSQNGAKIGEKVGAEKEQSAGTTWDEEPPLPVSLKEAPPPAINFWQQRKEAQDAKSKALKQVSPAAKSESATSNVRYGSMNGPPKGLDNDVDLKRQDTKKKAKGNVGPPDERTAPRAVKDGIKSADGKSRNGEEGGAHRPARSPEAEKPTAMAPPPPPGDAISWPTPDSAQGEEKKKAHDRVEKGERDKVPTTKPHGKEKWMPVPYVPSAVFNTPLPPSRRGGRPTRGREGGARGGVGHGGSVGHGGNGADKQTAQLGNTTGAVLAGVGERGRAEPSLTKNASNAPRTKRAASAGPPTLREQRNTADIVKGEKHRESDLGTKLGSQNGPAANEPRRTSGGAEIKSIRIDPNVSASNGASSASKPAHTTPTKDERRQSVPHDPHGHPKSAGSERRSEGTMRPSDYSRDFHGYMPMRERGEGRPERGRGGLRGRGGNHGFSNSTVTNGQGFSNGHPYQYQSPVPPQPSKSQSNHERHAAQSQGGPFLSSQSHGRHFRSSSRSQSIPHSAPYGRFPSGPHSGAPHLPNLQTDLANQYGYQPGNQGIMSAMPFNAYMEQVSLYGMVSMQMEYYFSVDNLCKDMFLRKHMDSQGFVFLSVLAKFNRIRQLTQDMELIRHVCLNSPNIEFRQGTDGIDRLRKREGWQQWVLNMEERDSSAQNDGLTPSQQPRVPHLPITDAPYGYDECQGPLSKFNGAITRPEDTQYMSSDGMAAPFVPSAPAPLVVSNGNTSDASVAQTPLSAAVPDFAPGRPSLYSRSLSLDASPNVASSFTDEQVESLMIVVRKPINPATPLPPPFHSQSSRTFSNGSIDGRTIHDELFKLEERQSRPMNNGDTPLDLGDMSRSQRSRSPFHLGSPSRQVNTNASPVFWVKDKDTPIDSLPNDLTHESYNVFRRNALKQREQVGAGNCHRDMDILYQFWSHFLIRNFNIRMYEEFRQVAFEDAKQQDSTVGIRNLIQYYDESILGQKVITDEIARDFVDLVKDDSLATKRLAFDKLRAAWRNGAFNLKNRKKIDNIIDAELKAELER